MAENSHISWTDNTHNEWIGCTKVSAGCDNCYAEREQDIRYGRAKWGKGNARYRTSEANRRKPFQWERQAIKEGRRIKVFTASLSDVFDEEVPDQWRDELFATITATPHLDWLVLTKRLAKMLRYVGGMKGDIPDNAWFGCSIEDQATANQRIPELLKLRALGITSPLWLSVEPLLGPINLQHVDVDRDGFYQFDSLTGRNTDMGRPCADVAHVDWVVVGGESGAAARRMHPEWARGLRDQCVAANVAFHFKQWGEFDGDGERVGKKAAGRMLDGREWNEFPKVVTS